MYFIKCPYCGSNNDPGEKCNCEGKKYKTENNMRHIASSKKKSSNKGKQHTVNYMNN